MDLQPAFVAEPALLAELGAADEVGAVAPVSEGREDADLAACALPYSTIKRIVKSSSPGVRFSPDAVAGFHRVAQAFALFATDRALAEQQKEADKLKKFSKSKNIAPARKTLTAEHVMRFLTSEFAPIASKVSTLFPDLMPSDFKPAGVLLLEQLRDQSGPVQVTAAEKRPLDADSGTTEQALKRPRHGADDGAAPEEALSKPGAAKKAKEAKIAPVAPRNASLSTFFGAPKASQKNESAPQDLEPVAESDTMEQDAQPLD